MAEGVVVDASALVDLLLGEALGQAVEVRLTGQVMHAPAHCDAEVLSALGRMHRADVLGVDAVSGMLGRMAAAPLDRHPVVDLLDGAWGKRHRLRLADALYVELAEALELRLVTTDGRLHPVSLADVVTV